LLHKGVYGNATVTICHSYTKNLKTITNSADILVAAIGVPGFVTADFIKENAICIDVGINQIVVNNEYAYVGDIDYNSCFDKALAITPVPGGVGSVTTSMLLANLTKAFIARTNKKIY
jgi:methylenetetrahydrofolate dehydrogenase (NADP+)/methenyltetrahydrofolate cyclohydrolase